MLGGGLLDEVGIKYLVADLPKHSATVLIASNGKVYWQEFRPGTKDFKGNYTEITSDMIDGEIDLLDVPESGRSLHSVLLLNWLALTFYITQYPACF